MATAMPEPVFKDISADDDAAVEPTVVESMCMSCGENGLTRILLTRIPHYREIILMSFECEACGFSNNEIQSGNRVQEKGVKFVVKIQDPEQDWTRQVVKADSAAVSIPELDLEIPGNSQKGQVTTVEGILQRTIEGLTQDQVVRRIMDPEGAKQIDDYVTKIEKYKDEKTPFTLIVRDPSGNSFVENPLAPASDPARTVSYFTRTKDEDHELGIYTQEEVAEVNKEEEELTAVAEEPEPVDDNALTAEKLENEILTFPTNCPECNSPANTNMKVTNIPHFKEVVIMATVCEYCDHKTNEVKSGGGIEPQGKRITLKVTDSTDLSRDVLKSETCRILIPDLDFEMGGFAIGGRFTTLEGLLTNMMEQLENNPFLGTGSVAGDATEEEARKRLKDFSGQFQEMIEGKKNFTFVMDDPAGNCYLQNVYAPDPDPEMTTEHYERTYEQNEELGLNDMVTENYGEKEIMAGNDK